MSNVRLILAKNKANAKQHPEVELLLFEYCSLSSSTLSFKNNRRYSKKCIKNKYICLNEVIWLITVKMRLEMKNRSNRCGINRPRPRYGHEYTTYIMRFSKMKVICIKQPWSNIWSSIHEKLSNTEGESKKSIAYEKNVSWKKKIIFKIDKAELFVTFLIAWYSAA